MYHCGRCRGCRQRNTPVAKPCIRQKDRDRHSRSDVPSRLYPLQRGNKHKLEDHCCKLDIIDNSSRKFCWRCRRVLGYLFNHAATIWASAVAIGGYGVWAAALPYMGAINAGDVVKVRSGKTLTLSTNTNVTWTMAAMGSAGSPVRFDIDDSSVWSDGTDPVLKITESHTGNTLKTWGHLCIDVCPYKRQTVQRWSAQSGC